MSEWRDEGKGFASEYFRTRTHDDDCRNSMYGNICNVGFHVYEF